MAAAHAKQYCIVTLGFQRLLLPKAQALKLMDLASTAMTVDLDYSGNGIRYRVENPLEVEVTTVRPGQLVMPTAELKPARPKRNQALLEAE